MIFHDGDAKMFLNSEKTSFPSMTFEDHSQKLLDTPLKQRQTTARFGLHVTFKAM